MKESLWKRIDERSTSIFRILMRIGILGLAAFLTLVLVNGVKKKHLPYSRLKYYNPGLRPA